MIATTSFHASGVGRLRMLSAVMLLAGCAPLSATTPPRPLDRAFERAAMIHMDSSGVFHRSIARLPVRIHTWPAVVRGCTTTLCLAPRTAGIHPLLERWLKTRLTSERVQLMVTFRDRQVLPRFPEPRTDEPRHSPANIEARAQADSMIRRIMSLRNKDYAADSAMLVREHHAHVLQKYWIAQALLVNMPLGDVPALSRRKDVVYIAPNHSGEPPPACTTADMGGRIDLPEVARNYMNTNKYLASETAHGWMSLFDTGVNADHEAFNLTATVTHPRIPVLGDCLGPCDDPAECPGGVCVGPSDCAGGETGDIDTYTQGHGTSAAAILVGYGRPNDCYSGLTQAELTSYRVYSSACCPVGCTAPCLVRSAVLNAFQATTAKLDRVIVAEMQALGPPDCDISDAADQAFNAGAMVIAAQGNCSCADCSIAATECPDDGMVKSPANAHYAIGVGAYDIKYVDAFFGGKPVAMTASCGPAPDGRIKPDVIAPTNTWVAGRRSTTDLHAFNSTSGATPYVGGAAMLLHDFLLDTSPSFSDPGLTYAALILAGRDTWTLQSNGTAQAEFDSKRGAGPIVLPGNFTGWFGSTTITTLKGGGVRIVLPDETTTSLEAAIWWADPKDACGGFHHCQVHLDIESWLYGVGGPEVFTTSNSPTSVFQRATLSGFNPGDDEWFVMFNLMDDEFSRTLSGLTVYYAIAARK